MTDFVSPAVRAGRRRAVGAMCAGLLLFDASPALAEDVTIALTSSVNTFDPAQAQVVGTDVSMLAHLYTALVKRTPRGELIGDLATAWHTEGEDTWVFTLRSDVTFPGGEPLDAAAVKWNIDRIRDPETKARNRAWFDPVTDVEVVSPTEIKFHTKGAYPALPAQLAMVFFLEPTWAGMHNPATEVYGSGPYELASYAPGDSMVMRAKANHYDGDVAFDSVTVRTITEAGSRVAGIETGELDFVTDIPLEEIDRLNVGGRADADWVPSTRTFSIRINNTIEPFKDNVPLRQALNYAVDKEAIVQGLLGGRGTVSNCQLITPAYFGYNSALQPYAYDPDKARELIARSGATVPVDVELQIPTGRYFMASEIGQIVAAMLQEVGVNATIHEMDFSGWVKEYAAGNMGPLALSGQAWPTLDADGIMTLYTSGNRTGYFQNGEFDAAVQTARETVEEDARRAAYAEATQIMCEQAPVVFLFAQPYTYATSKKIKWDARGDDWVLASDLELE